MKVSLFLRRTRLAGFLRRLYRTWFPRPEDLGVALDEPLRFVSKGRAVVHVGAHAGQEGWIYNVLRRPVIWFEANPSLMPRLRETIRPYFRQRAFQALLFDRDGVEIQFRITNYDGGASSAFDLAGHRAMYPGIEVIETLPLRSTTLSEQLDRIDPEGFFDILVLDVQGAELKVLEGAGERLSQFKWIYTEASDFDLYAGGCLINELSAWLSSRGFIEERRFVKDVKPGLGQTLDVLFLRTNESR